VPPISKKRLLAVDDSAATRELLHRNLTAYGYHVQTASGVSEALRIIEASLFDLVITDLKMPGASGLDLVRYVRENLKDTEVVMITGYPSVEGAVTAIKLGAEEYLPKPFTQEELRTTVERALAKLDLRKAGQKETASTPGFSSFGIVGESEAMQKVFRAIHRAAEHSGPVLVRGENGTGKELVARAVHYSSARAVAPFVNVCCSSPGNILEREIFGLAERAVQDSDVPRIGVLHYARGGTIFLEEIAELPPNLQDRFLRILQGKEFLEGGPAGARPFDIRLVASTSQDLGTLVVKDRFRGELFLQLNVNTITVPPLRDRESDVLLIAHHLLTKLSAAVDKPVSTFAPRAMEVVRSYPWPGNLAELRNFVHALIAAVEDDVIEVPDFPACMRSWLQSGSSLKRSLAELEAEHIRNVLGAVGGNKSVAAEILGIDRKTLREKLKNRRTRSTSGNRS
jgi:DNA-binding NtrC family response regulator